MTSKAGRRVLVIEDEGIVLLDLELILSDLGYAVVGSASDLAGGRTLAERLDVDIAVLDVNLAGHDSGPIADILAARNIPFVFVSGYTAASLPEGHTTRPSLPKPYNPEFLRDVLERELASPSRAGA